MVYIHVQSLTTALCPVARGINLHGSHFLLVKSGFVVGRILEFACLLCLSSQVELECFFEGKIVPHGFMVLFAFSWSCFLRN